MKYGRVLTYKDAEEAKKLIGKKVVGSYCLSKIENYPEKIAPEILTGIDDELDFIFEAGDYYGFQFIREIIEEPQLMTDRQLSEWIVKGNGVYSYEDSDFAYTNYAYNKSRPDAPVSDSIFIRSWDSEEWVLPTVDIYERDCTGERK